MKLTIKKDGFDEDNTGRQASYSTRFDQFCLDGEFTRDELIEMLNAAEKVKFPDSPHRRMGVVFTHAQKEQIESIEK